MIERNVVLEVSKKNIILNYNHLNNKKNNIIKTISMENIIISTINRITLFKNEDHDIKIYKENAINYLSNSCKTISYKILISLIKRFEIKFV